MINFFTSFICILLVIVIVILVFKLSFESSFESSLTEPFEVNQSISNDLLNNLSNDPEVISALKKKINNSIQQEEVFETVNNIKNILSDTSKLQTDMNNINSKKDSITPEYNSLIHQYTKNKRIIDKKVFDKLKKDTNINSNQQRINTFKNTLQNFLTTLRTSQVENSFERHYFKNKVNNIELTLQKIKHPSSDCDGNDNDNDNYYLFLNGKCVKIKDALTNSDKKFELDRCYDIPNYYFRFYVIDSREKNIDFLKLSNLSQNKDIDDNIELLTSVQNDYSEPFYIICPLFKPGFCVKIKDRNLSITPYMNESFQHFTKEDKSLMC